MIVMGAATVNDLIGSSPLRVDLKQLRASERASFARIRDLCPGSPDLVLMLTVGRIVGSKAQDWLKARLPWPGAFLGLTIVFVLLMAALMEMIGVDDVRGFPGGHGTLAESR